MDILVTGGAGYVGSVSMAALERAGHKTWALDNLSRGHAEAVPAGRLVEADLADTEAVARALAEKDIDAVLHCAALAYVGESVARPGRYWRNNVGGTVSLLEAMRATGVEAVVFSSSCAVYGEPEKLPLDESHPQNPVNPYGWTKLACEEMMREFARAHGLRWIALRYFNAAGAALDGSLGEAHDPESHLIPLALAAAGGTGKPLTIFGDDYPTRDGTCVRDYIHVEDLAEAHRLAIEHLAGGAGGGGGGGSCAYNLGTETGSTVREVIASVERVTKKKVPCAEGARREGDPPELVASSEAIRRDWGWAPRCTSLDDIVKSAWAWMQQGGFGGRG